MVKMLDMICRVGIFMQVIISVTILLFNTDRRTLILFCTLGDFTKFLFPYASFTTILNWGLLDWANGYNETVVDNAFDTVRRSLDYLMRMHPSPNQMYVQIGNGSLDHTLWDRCENWPHGPRTTFEINETAPGSDIASGM